MVSRFETYGIRLDGQAADYAAAVSAMPAMRDWCVKAGAETRTDPDYDHRP